MSFPMASGSGADCGPVNPMAGLMKQFQQDRSLQQERFVGDQRAESSKAGFRSGQGSLQQPLADRQFADEFMNDAIAREQPGMFEFNGLGRELEAIQHGPPLQHQHQQHAPPHMHGAEWSGDFMKQHGTVGPAEGQFDHFESVYQQSHAGPSTQQQLDHSQPIHHQYQHHQQYIPQRNMYHPIQGGGSLLSQYSSPMATTQNTALENEQFERAFDAANKDAQVEPITQDDWASEFAEKEGISEDATNNDALARTAAMLLDSVDVNDNPKFKNSQFMSLMQKLRDREVHVEGDKMVESPAKEGQQWSSEFQGQTFQTQQQQMQQARQQQQQNGDNTRDWVDDFIPKAGSEQSGNIWTPEFASKLERGWAESSTAGSQQQNWSDQFQQQQDTDMSQEEMQRLFGRGTEMDDWVQQYQRNIAHLKDAKDSEWDGMQKDWDRFKDEQGMGYRAVNPDYDTYNFTTTNPYLMDHAAIDGIQHNTLTDSILALEAKAQLETNNAEAWQALGLRQQENERDASAIAALRKAVNINPGLLEGWLALSVSYTNENCRADAYDSLEQWIANNPTYQHLITQQPAAKHLSDHDRHSYITNLFLEAARSSPGAEMDANVQVGLGVLFNVSEEYEKAIDCFKAAVASRPQDYLLWNKLGATLANSKDTTGAIDAYFNALEINPSYVRARYNLAISCINLNQHKEAAEHLLTALALQQQDDQGHAAAQNPLLDQTGQPVSVPGGMSENVWDSLRMVMFMMKREDLAVQCDRRNLDIFRSEFDF